MTEVVEVVEVAEKMIGWGKIPIHPIVCFFGFFTLTSIISAWVPETEKTLSQGLILSTLLLSVTLFVIITIHNVLELTKMTFPTNDIYNVTFALFSFAWGTLVFVPMLLFFILFRRAD